MQNPKINLVVIMLFVCLAFMRCYPSDKGTFNIGVLYNGLIIHDYTSGIGTSLGFEYRPAALKNISLSLRYKYVYYHYDDGSKEFIKDDGTLAPYNKNPRLSYNLHTQQIGLVPKFYFELMDGVELFIENEFNIVAVTGVVKYLLDVNQKRKISDYIPFTYSAIVGFEIKEKRVHYGISLGYTSLNFKDNVAKKRPYNYTSKVPRLDTGLLLNFYFKIPVFK